MVVEIKQIINWVGELSETFSGHQSNNKGLRVVGRFGILANIGYKVGISQKNPSV